MPDRGTGRTPLLLRFAPALRATVLDHIPRASERIGLGDPLFGLQFHEVRTKRLLITPSDLSSPNWVDAPGMAPLHPVRDASHRDIHANERRQPPFHGQVGRVDVGGEAWQVANEEVDRGVALKARVPIPRRRTARSHTTRKRIGLGNPLFGVQLREGMELPAGIRGEMETLKADVGAGGMAASVP